jgi:hypothetical protein
MPNPRQPKTFNLYVVCNEAGYPTAVANMDTGCCADKLYVFAEDKIIWHGAEKFALAFAHESPISSPGFKAHSKVRTTKSKKVEGQVKGGLPAGKGYKYSVETDFGPPLDPEIIIER